MTTRITLVAGALYRIVLWVAYFLIWSWRRPLWTTEDLTLYVSVDGSDFFGKGTKEKPFRSGQRASWALPRIIKHQMCIEFSSGDYHSNLGPGSVSFKDEGTLAICGAPAETGREP